MVRRVGEVTAGEVMSARTPGTRVTFPTGDVAGAGRVERVEHLDDGRLAVITDVTPFHPLDHAWPDQPADTGTLAGFPVVDCVTGAAEGGSGAVLVGPAIPVRRGDPAWEWYVVHVVDIGDALPPLPGDPVDLQVDAARRVALSAGHTACHLSALALNAEAAHFWRKDVDRLDSLGNPDLDQIAITGSRIEEGGAYDAYRLGKSLRKKGFATAEFVTSLADVQRAVDERLAAWVAQGAPVRVGDAGDGGLTARRTWTCELAEGTVVVPCGGTHVASLAALGSVTVGYSVSDDGALFEVRTRVG